MAENENTDWFAVGMQARHFAKLAREATEAAVKCESKRPMDTDDAIAIIKASGYHRGRAAAFRAAAKHLKSLYNNVRNAPPPTAINA